MNQLPGWVTIQRHGQLSGWRLVESWYNSEEDDTNDGTTNVYVIAYRADGSPALNAQATQINGGMTPLPFHRNDSGQAQADFPMSHDSIFYPDRGEVGAYTVLMHEGASG